MKKLLAVLLLLAPMASARVLSYAPYSDKPAMRGYHERTSRYFLLVEGDAASVYDGLVYNGNVVLYDSTGAEGPRVIFPAGGGVATIRAVAMYERDGLPPVFLVITGWPSTNTFISRDGARSWRQIERLNDLTPVTARSEDFGGPWTQGLGAPILINATSGRFIVSYHRGIFAIGASGVARPLYDSAPGALNKLLGQNRAGTSFLIQTHRNALVTVDLEGRTRSAGTGPESPQYGWISDDGAIFVVATNIEQSRNVYRYEGRRGTLVATTRLLKSFAVPTHDSNGFWFLEHEKNFNTVLSRYTRATGLQMMWEDRDAPEVEALHPNAADDVVLIQVHRERLKQDLSFLDPAIAIWRIGEPAPAGYDELFLMEGPRKGFVHLDVDKVAAGEPFVFDSGFIRPAPPDVVVSPPPANPGGGGADVVQEWGVVRASLDLRLVVQGVTREGAWTTDLVMYNPLDQPQRVGIEYVAGESIQSRAKADVAVDLAAHEIRVVSDILGALFAVEEGSGTLHVRPESGGVTVQARVQHRKDGKSSGYAIPSIDFMNAASPRFPVTFAAVWPSVDFRSSLVVTDTSGQGIDARVQTLAKTGIVDEESINASGAEINGAVVVRPVRGSLIAGTVAIDQRTNDGSYFTPDLPASAIRTVPFVGSVENPDGSRLVTTIHLVNFSPDVRTVTLEVKPYDISQWPRQQTYRLEPYESRTVVDPLKTFFNLTGTARMRYWSFGAQGDSTGVRVAAWANTVDTNGGTYGTSLPPMNSFQSVTKAESLELVGFTKGQRASLGLVELSPNTRNQPSRVKITIFDERGTTVDTFETTVQPAGGVFLADLFASRNIEQPAAARVTVEVLDEWGLVGAYGILTDPTTNDPTYLGAALVAKLK